ncbi:uncharacterized protein LOC133710068 isoform X5 [Rosa rugosa]|uniref:uncharacterized protein LOC133710068 isoform X5 n=1 Tax=Rosa rugosa TaxID=74645 RepID=UPI002B4050FC|nr:uncharacterized protein LOC133710068 isoform X5 [Rosa rugosa]
MQRFLVLSFLKSKKMIDEEHTQNTKTPNPTVNGESGTHEHSHSNSTPKVNNARFSISHVVISTYLCFLARTHSISLGLLYRSHSLASISGTLLTLCPYEVQIKLEYVTQISSTEKIFRLQRLPVLSFCVGTKRYILGSGCDTITNFSSG